MSLAAMQTRQASAQTEQGAAGLCRDCASFSSSAAALEQAFPGLTLGIRFGALGRRPVRGTWALSVLRQQLRELCAALMGDSISV